MPTASDMAQLGNMLISGHRQRNVEIAGMRTEAREFLGHLHNLDLARRRDTQRHAAQTGRFMGQLHDLTRRRKARNRATMRHLHGQDMGRREEVQEHAAETGDFVHNLHLESLQRRNGARQHAAETGRFMGQLHNITRARRRDVRRHAAETVRFVRYLHGVTRERKNQIGELMSHFAGLDVARRAEVAELVGHARAFMAGLAAITQEGRDEWRRQLVAIDPGRKTASAGRRASPRVGTAVAGAASKAEGRRQESNRDVGSLVAAYVARHPGTRLPEMERALGINRIEAAKGVRALLDQGTVRRDEETRQYFPV